MNKADLEVLPPLKEGETPEQYLAHVAHLTGKDLPAIIDRTGFYRLRNGKVATIHRIDAPDIASFNCKGYIRHKRKKNGDWKQEYQIWQPNGRFQAIGEHPNDIVKRESP